MGQSLVLIRRCFFLSFQAFLVKCGQNIHLIEPFRQDTGLSAESTNIYCI